MILQKLIRDTYTNQKFFDANNREHLKEFGYFMKYNKWKNNCPFILEWPYQTVPGMIKDKLAVNLTNLVK